MMLKPLASCCVLLLASAACGGHSDVPGIPVGSTDTEKDPSHAVGTHGGTGTPSTGTHHEQPSGGSNSQSDAGVPQQPAEIAGANIRLLNNEMFSGYLRHASVAL